MRSTHCLTCWPSSPRAKATRRPWKPEMPEAGSTVKVRTFSGVLCGDLLDVHAALGRADEGDARGDAVDEQREVELAGDVGAVLDVDAVDRLAGGAGLLGDEGAAEHLLGLVGGVGDRLGDADAALVAGGGLLELALAAAAGVDLGLDHPDRAVDLARGGLGLVGLQHRRGRRRPGRRTRCRSCLAWYS